MEKAIIIKRFKNVGLSCYEAKSYMSLLEKETLTVTEVAKIAQIPRSNAYEALEKLMAKGFCVAKPGKTKKYSATNPVFLKEKIVSVLTKSFDKEFQEIHRKESALVKNKKASLEDFGKLLDELTPTFHKNRSNENPINYIEILKDPDRIRQKFVELVSGAKSEVLIFTKPPYTGPMKFLEEQTEKQAEPLRRGITIKSIYEIPNTNGELEWWDNDLKSWYNDIDDAAKQGENSRVIAELPMKMVVIDERIVILPLQDPVATDTSFTAQVIEHPSLAKGLKILFKALWQKAEEYHVLRDVRSPKQKRRR